MKPYKFEMSVQGVYVYDGSTSTVYIFYVTFAHFG